MSDNIATVVESLNKDAELRDRVMNASSNDERKQILESAGLTVPSQAEIENHQALADVSGAGIIGQQTGTIIGTVLGILG